MHRLEYMYANNVLSSSEPVYPVPPATLHTDQSKGTEFIIESPGGGLQAPWDSGVQTSGVLSHPLGSALAPPTLLQPASPVGATSSQPHFQRGRVGLPRAQPKASRFTPRSQSRCSGEFRVLIGSGLDHVTSSLSLSFSLSLFLSCSYPLAPPFICI